MKLESAPVSKSFHNDILDIIFENERNLIFGGYVRDRIARLAGHITVKGDIDVLLGSPCDRERILNKLIRRGYTVNVSTSRVEDQYGETDQYGVSGHNFHRMSIVVIHNGSQETIDLVDYHGKSFHFKPDVDVNRLIMTCKGNYKVMPGYPSLKLDDIFQNILNKQFEVEYGCSSRRIQKVNSKGYRLRDRQYDF